MTASILNENEKLALEVIRRRDGVSRTELAQALGITRMHATNVIKALATRELIIDTAASQGRRGQPTRIVSLKPDSHFAIGATFTDRTMEVGLVNWVGDLKSRDTIRIDGASLDHIGDTLKNYHADVFKRHRVAKRRSCGIGISLPGDFVKDRQTINAVYFPEFAGIDLRHELQARVGAPVFVENDSSSAAWGESIIGLGQSLQSFVFIHIGHGIGGGLVFNGRLFRGHHGNAGAFGAPFPNLDTCRPSGSDLLKTLRQHGIQVDDFADLKTLEIDTTPALADWIERAAAQLIPPLTVLARAIDPQALIIGGRLPRHIIQGLVERIDTPDFCGHDRDRLPVPKIYASSLCETAGVIGAASLCLEDTFFRSIT